ncbi:hypothetical protein LCGC14_1620200 [marine sediment metagenome]|uniref:Uncharacterized protein n=1 Tax=marine sediment metagenome TaxID=412755 RepID=A0A0F9I5Q7_9ZZZZ
MAHRDQVDPEARADRAFVEFFSVEPEADIPVAALFVPGERGIAYPLRLAIEIHGQAGPRTLGRQLNSIPEAVQVQYSRSGRPREEEYHQQ